jgi:hypothetical protein
MKGAVPNHTLIAEALPAFDDYSSSALFYGLGAEPERVDVTANFPLNGGNGAWLPASLPLAMALNLPLHLTGPQDSLALQNANDVQELLGSWHGHLSKIKIDAAEVESNKRVEQRGVGCFFSGGVDSFFSAIERSHEITHLIFVTGFDIDIENDVVSDQALAAARLAASSLGKELIEVRTNVRKASDGIVSWATLYHGAGLATIGLLLSNVVEKVIIPASYHQSELFPWGSHPSLDVLWTSSAVEIEHHGTFATRPEKVAKIAQNEAAMNHLRICWKNPGGAFNCGTCEKCMRTMVNLRIAGSLERCRTLPDVVDLHRLRSFHLGKGSMIFAKQNLVAARKARFRDQELIWTLQQIVWMAPFWDAARSLRTALRP